MSPVRIIDMRAEMVRLAGGQDFDYRPITPQCFFSIHYWGSPALGQGIETATLMTFRYHRYTQGWSNIGYHYLVSWPSGDVAYIGDIFTARANIWGRNHESIGICFEGTELTDAMREGIRCAIDEARAEILRRDPTALWVSSLPIYGHCEVALPQSPTACPGEQGRALVRELRGNR